MVDTGLCGFWICRGPVAVLHLESTGLICPIEAEVDQAVAEFAGPGVPLTYDRFPLLGYGV